MWHSLSQKALYHAMVVAEAAIQGIETIG